MSSEEEVFRPRKAKTIPRTIHRGTRAPEGRTNISEYAAGAGTATIDQIDALCAGRISADDARLLHALLAPQIPGVSATALRGVLGRISRGIDPVSALFIETALAEPAIRAAVAALVTQDLVEVYQAHDHSWTFSLTERGREVEWLGAGRRMQRADQIAALARLDALLAEVAGDAQRIVRPIAVLATGSLLLGPGEPAGRLHVSVIAETQREPTPDRIAALGRRLDALADRAARDAFYRNDYAQCDYRLFLAEIGRLGSSFMTKDRGTPLRAPFLGFVVGHPPQIHQIRDAGHKVLREALYPHIKRREADAFATYTLAQIASPPPATLIARAIEAIFARRDEPADPVEINDSAGFDAADLVSADDRPEDEVRTEAASPTSARSAPAGSSSTTDFSGAFFSGAFCLSFLRDHGPDCAGTPGAVRELSGSRPAAFRPGPNDFFDLAGKIGLERKAKTYITPEPETDRSIGWLRFA